MLGPWNQGIATRVSAVGGFFLNLYSPEYFALALPNPANLPDLPQSNKADLRRSILTMYSSTDKRKANVRDKSRLAHSVSGPSKSAYTCQEEGVVQL